MKIDPFVIPIPDKWAKDLELSPTVQYIWRVLYDVIQRTGGGGNSDFIEELQEDVLALDVRVDIAENDINQLESAVDALDARVDALEAATAHKDSVEIDFGSTPVWDATFQITDAAIAADSHISVMLGGAATGRTADDWQWDGAVVGVVPDVGVATCYVTFHPGPIVGPRKFNYMVS